MNIELKQLIDNLQFLHACLSIDEIDDRYVVLEAIKKLSDYDEALRMMVYQYCTVEYPDDNNREVFDHRFMSAGETAFDVLGIRRGDEVPEGFVW